MYLQAGVTIVAKNRIEARVLLEARARSVSVTEALSLAMKEATSRRNETLCGQRPDEFLGFAQRFNACDTRPTRLSACTHVQVCSACPVAMHLVRTTHRRFRTAHDSTSVRTAGVAARDGPRAVPPDASCERRLGRDALPGACLRPPHGVVLLP